MLVTAADPAMRPHAWHALALPALLLAGLLLITQRASAQAPPAELPSPSTHSQPQNTSTSTPTPTPTAIPPCGLAWRAVAIPNPTSNYSQLNGIEAVSTNDVWAVGYTDTRTLTMRWNGSAWRIVPSPNQTGDNQLNGMAAVSANDVWAVGSFFNASVHQTLVEHWNGSAWSIVPSPNPGPSASVLIGVAAVSANDVWAVGY